MIPERRSCVRHQVHGPVFASFDGVTGGMILDLSEQGVSMQTVTPLQAERRMQLRLDLPDSDILETTGYVAWADALGRAGVRFSELPAEARHRLDEWLAHNEKAPSRKAPKLTFDMMLGSSAAAWPTRSDPARPRSVSLEAEPAVAELPAVPGSSNTMQYEFKSLGSDLNSALRTISERAQTLLRGTGAAIALIDGDPTFARPMLCRASVGRGGPGLGTHVDADSGFSGQCIRTGKALRCDDCEIDLRVDAANCRRLGVRSMVVAPIRYERAVVGLVAVFSSKSFAFDEGDLAVLERLAQTVLLMLSQAQLFKHS
jgi:hypothetical protein